MKFTVSYRSGDGALQDEVFETASREECFTLCRERGIVPVRVREGDVAKRSGIGTGTSCRTRNVVLSVAAALVMAFCVCGGAWWYVAFRTKDVSEPPPKESDPKHGHSTSKTKHPKPRANLPPELATTNVQEKPVTAQPVKTNEVWNGHEIATTLVSTNGDNIITTRIGVDGKKYKQIAKVNEQPIFDNPVDQVLALMLTTPKGSVIPPPPPLGAEADEVFIKGLKRPIEIRDDDSPEVKRVKRIVMAAREEMIEELGAGHSVNEVIAKHCMNVNENAKLRAQAVAEYRRILDEEGDEAMAEQYREKANGLLVNAGAVPIDKRGPSSRSRQSPNERKQEK